MPDALRLAFGTFTAVRVAPPLHVDGATAGRAMLLAPLTALPSAMAWIALGLSAVHGWLAPHVAGALAVAVTTLASRAIHVDGLADTADGLSAGYEPQRALEVMRRGDVGPSGVAAVVLVLLVEATAVAALAESAHGVALAVTALLASRLAPAVSCRSGTPAARAEGLGHTVAGSVTPARLTGVVAALAAGILLAAWAIEIPWYAALLVLGSAVLPAWLVTRRVVRRLGGITGDTIGAAIELSLAAALVVAAVASAAIVA